MKNIAALNDILMNHLLADVELSYLETLVSVGSLISMIKNDGDTNEDTVDDVEKDIYCYRN